MSIAKKRFAAALDLIFSKKFSGVPISWRNGNA